MKGLCSQDWKPKISKEGKVILIFKKIKSYKGLPKKSCYSIESSQSFKARFFSSSGNPKSKCEENDVLNS
jgi:cytochrome c5